VRKFSLLAVALSVIVGVALGVLVDTEKPPLFEVLHNCDAKDFVGTAFLVSEKHLLTAAHVAMAALSTNPYERKEVKTGDVVYVRIAGNYVPERAQVAFFSADYDISVLTLSTPITDRKALKVGFRKFNYGEVVSVLGCAPADGETTTGLLIPIGSPSFISKIEVINPRYRLAWGATVKGTSKSDIIDCVLLSQGLAGGFSGSAVIDADGVVNAIYVGRVGNLGIAVYLAYRESDLRAVLDLKD